MQCINGNGNDVLGSLMAFIMWKPSVIPELIHAYRPDFLGLRFLDSVLGDS